MKESDQKVGKIFLVFAGICIIALPFIVFSAFSNVPDETDTAVIKTDMLDFDHKGNAFFENYDQITEDYLKETSPVRTLNEFYSRRQYIHCHWLSGRAPVHQLYS